MKKMFTPRRLCLKFILMFAVCASEEARGSIH